MMVKKKNSMHEAKCMDMMTCEMDKMQSCKLSIYRGSIAPPYEGNGYRKVHENHNMDKIM